MEGVQYRVVVYLRPQGGRVSCWMAGDYLFREAAYIAAYYIVNLYIENGAFDLLMDVCVYQVPA